MSDVDTKEEIISPKSRLAALLLGIFLGNLGIHNFYLGQTGRGIWKIILYVFGLVFYIIGVALLAVEEFGFGGFLFFVGIAMLLANGIWALVEWILIACGAAKDSKGLPVKNW